MLVTERLTDQILERFSGGNVRIENKVEDYLFEGTVASMRIEGTTLCVQLSELRKVSGAGGVDDGGLKYAIDLQIARDVGLERTRLYVDTSPILWEKATFTCSEEQAAKADPIELPALLTDEQLKPFIGGDVEVHLGKGPISDTWRGPISAASVVDDVLEVTCTWVGFLQRGMLQWTKHGKNQFRWDLKDYQISPQGNRLIISHREGPDKGMIVLFPQGKNLDPAKVEGLTV